MDIRVNQGRPEDLTGRLAKEVKAYDFLDAACIDYVVADHPEAFTMEICEEIGRVLDTDICKNLFLCNRQQTSFYLLLMPGDKKFKTKDISAQIGSSRLSFADENHMLEMMDLTPGSVTVLGLMNDKEGAIRLVIDEDLLKGSPTIGIHPCINTSTVRLTVEDLMQKLVPAIGHEPTIVTLPVCE